MEERKNKTAAFFDLDHTVLHGASGTLYGWKMFTEGFMSLNGLLLVIWYSILYKTNHLPRQVVYRRVFEIMGRFHILEMIAFMDRNFELIIAPRLYREAYDIILSHKKRGHLTVIATAAGEYVAERVRTQLEVDYVIATPIPVEDERVSAYEDGPTAFMEHKLEMAEKFCSDRSIDLKDCYFYSDSVSDLPLLEAVGHPVAANPHRALARIAKERGWPIMRFKEYARFDEIRRPERMITPEMEKYNRIYEDSLLKTGEKE
ncbi:MAG: HAD-IB family hydrolase [Actinobacteria bacterium]|nr:HAD-IB family hydrolase [Actinomycetota bacterium]